MILKLQMLNSDAELNSFFDIGTAQFIPGQPLTLNMRLIQRERNLRYVPEDATTYSMNFQLSDGTTLTKTPIQLDASDRSLLTVSLTDVETQTLIGQNLTVELVEPVAGQSAAYVQMGLKAIKLDNC